MNTLLVNQSLLAYNTFGVEATARYFMEADSLAAVQTALRLPEVQGLPLLVLGGGSNLLFTRNFEGLVLKISLKGIELLDEDKQFYYVRAAAGENWHGFVQHCIAHGWAGVENLSLIPGTVGAAPIQNIGAYGVELKDVFEELQAIAIADGSLHTFSHSDCRFAYRESIFKHQAKGQYIIISVTFRLSKIPRINTSYGAISQTLAEMGIASPTIAEVSRAVIRIRQSKLPDPAELGNAGSFFKNPEIPKTQFEALQHQYPDMPAYPAATPDCVKVAAGWLIEQCGWKGKRMGNTGAHRKQALVLVNYGGASGMEIWQLAQQIQASVAEKFGICLQPEVNII
ncbi:MAG: UDP-N-acetylmuramate dehydrogenase [Cytophagales bacterium]|nr:UDP-N-acetylmuramate dehydrogenase [Cytophagales bacterium]